MLTLIVFLRKRIVYWLLSFIKFKIWVPILLLVCCFNLSFGQESTSREVTFPYSSKLIKLDSQMISPVGFQLSGDGKILGEKSYKINFFKSELILDSKLEGQSFKAVFRVFPQGITQIHRNKEPYLLRDSAEQVDPRITNFSYYYDDNPYFSSGSGLSKSGTISRGISLGNNQDLSINSSLNLQLSGKLNEDVNVLASITDDNIPIQPEGNTQQLQDFDQVFIQLYNDKRKLTAGDFWITSDKTHFLRYNKRGQGAAYEQSIAIDSNSRNNSSASLAVSKGKYSRNIIQAVEGNQGPYRLTGAENERFIIVLSGTERVFIDGVLMKRGQDYDYIVDYNLAEIVFTPKTLMTKDRRIVVEFQYSDKNYSRSLFHFKHEIEREKSNLRLNVYSEQDHKNQPLQFELSDTSKVFTLINSGDDITKMVSTGADSVGYSNSAVFYKEVDTLGYTPVYVKSDDPSVAFFQIRFSEVGSGRGDYIETDFSALGRVYRWIKPDTLSSGEIVRRGKFEPVVILTSPKKRQIVSLGGDVKITKNAKIYSEVAMSNYDENSFSSIDDNDNIGLATKIGFLSGKKLGARQKTTFNTQVEGEYVQSKFSFVERFRDIEFERNWNLNNALVLSDQIMGKATFGLVTESGLLLTAKSNYFYVDTTFTGVKQDFIAALERQTYKLNYSGSYLISESIEKTNFYRHKGLAEKSIGLLTFGFKDEMEQNTFRNKETDSLTFNSYNFYDWQAYIKSPDSTVHSVSVFYRERLDEKPQNNQLFGAAKASGFGLDYRFSKTFKNVLKLRAEYRDLKILDSVLINQAPENTVVGRLDYAANWGDGFFTANTYYEIGSGLEQKKEFVYIETLPGQGNFQWVDYNGNNVKDINEFESAQFSDQANFIRVFTPSNEYIKTFNNQFSFVTSINPAAKWNSSKGVKKLLSKLSNQSSVSRSRKTTGQFIDEYYNPFWADVDDVALSSLSSSLRNIFFLNRTGSVFGAEYVFQNNSSKILLTNGFDTRYFLGHEVRTRLNFAKNYELVLTGSKEQKLNTSDYTNNRNYDLDIHGLTSKISYQPNSKFRIELNGLFNGKKNSLNYGGEEASNLSFGSVVKLNAQEKGLFLIEFNRVQNTFSGEENSPVEFEMLEGLKVGENYTWGVSVQRKLSKTMQLTLNYNGRKTPSNPSIHFGGLQVRAFF